MRRGATITPGLIAVAVVGLAAGFWLGRRAEPVPSKPRPEEPVVAMPPLRREHYRTPAAYREAMRQAYRERRRP